MVTYRQRMHCLFSVYADNYCPKYLPAPEAGLYLLLETLIGPIIVWILVGEVPRRNDFIGGALLLAALVGLFTYRIRFADGDDRNMVSLMQMRCCLSRGFWVLVLGSSVSRT